MLLKPIRRVDIELSNHWHFLVLGAFVGIVSRRPDVLFNPQFWAEDGAVWYADAYNLGALHSLVLPHTGYFQTISRIMGVFAQLFPLAIAPLIFNLTAIVIQILPAIFIISSRFSALIPNPSNRVFLAFVYLALPNSYEVNANITNAQWHLGLLACMVLLATLSQCPTWRFFDVGVILLAGLSGPLSTLLVPIAAFRWYLGREKWLFFLLLELCTCAMVQGVAIFFTAQATRSQVPSLGATLELFARILAGQVFLGSLLGEKGDALINSPHQGPALVPTIQLLFAILITIFGLAAVLYSLLKAPLELRLFAIFATFTLSATLISPVVSSTIPQWQMLPRPGSGGRYWFIPMLAFITILTWMRGKQCPKKLRMCATLALVLLFFGILSNWHYHSFTDFNFQDYSNNFTGVPKGAKVIIPINPPGWSMELIKH